jgi:hypothetical protein
MRGNVATLAELPRRAGPFPRRRVRDRARRRRGARRTGHPSRGDGWPRPRSRRLRSGIPTVLNPRFNRWGASLGVKGASCIQPIRRRAHGPHARPRASRCRARARARVLRAATANITGGIHVKVVLLMGGRSAEREISLRTGHGISRSLRNLGHDVVAIDAADGRHHRPGRIAHGRARGPAGAGRTCPRYPWRALAGADAVKPGRGRVHSPSTAARARTAPCRRLLEPRRQALHGVGRARERARDEQGDGRNGCSSARACPRARGSSSPPTGRRVDTEALGGYPLVDQAQCAGLDGRPHDRHARRGLGGRPRSGVRVRARRAGRAVHRGPRADRRAARRRGAARGRDPVPRADTTTTIPSTPPA